MTVEATFRRCCINCHYTSAAGVTTALYGVSTHITSRSGLDAQQPAERLTSAATQAHPAPSPPPFVLRTAQCPF